MGDIARLASWTIAVVVDDHAVGATKYGGGRERTPLWPKEAGDMLWDTDRERTQGVHWNGKVLGKPPGAERGVLFKAKLSPELYRILFRFSLEPPP